ncbi:MAG: alpha-N-arabinofuranosidase [Planctomycetota bacterium]
MEGSESTETKSCTINRNIYGHFAEHLGRCIYEGLWVGEDSETPNTRGIRNDVVAALKAIRVPVLRWPGGCFADEYHWRDGIGPREARPAQVNTHWGGVTESNHFGTHEFLDLCEQLECAPYICGNVGSGDVREMQQWVEYITLGGGSVMSDLRKANGRERAWKLPYFGVGNENWGCGGNMRPEYYADCYRRFQKYVYNFSGNKVFKIACGPNSANYDWTEVLMREAGRQMHGLALHFYCGSGRKKGLATEFEEADWSVLLKNALRMEELVTKHSAIMDRYDPERRVALVVDEWGTWHAVEPGTEPGFLYQQNTIRDALVASVTLDVFNNHCDRVRMANIAQTVNVLQAMVLTDGPRMLRTPTYHVFEMYAVHQDAEHVPTLLAADRCAFGDDSIPKVSASASRDAGGKLHLSLSNLAPNGEAKVRCVLRGDAPKAVSGRILTSADMHAHNTFDAPGTVTPADFDGARVTAEGVAVAMPPMSVVVLELA